MTKGSLFLPTFLPYPQVLPIENMDGRALLEQGELCRRKTASNVDLNRNYPFAWKGHVSGTTDDGSPAGSAIFSVPLLPAPKGLWCKGVLTATFWDLPFGRRASCTCSHTAWHPQEPGSEMFGGAAPFSEPQSKV